jgi:hypothetical protein
MTASPDNKAARPQKFKRRWRNFLLDRRYQLKYTLVMVVIAGALTAGLGYGILRQTKRVEQASAEVAQAAAESSRIMDMRAMGESEDDPTVKEMKKAIAEQDAVHKRQAEAMQRQAKFVPYALAGFFLLLTMFLGAYGIIMTHRVAGPLFKIANYLKRMTDNRFGEIYDLRKGDELQEFFATFKQAYNAVKSRTQEDLQALTALSGVAEELGKRHPELEQELAPVLLELRTMVEDKRRSLE